MNDPHHRIKSLCKSFKRISNQLEFDNEFIVASKGKMLKIVSSGVYLINNINDIELRILVLFNSPEHMICKKSASINILFLISDLHFLEILGKF